MLLAIVQLCFEARNFKALNENIVILTKRRSQIKQSITKMIQECCTYVDQITDKATQLQYIETLRTVTAGKVSFLSYQSIYSFIHLFIHLKIYVEVERARLTHKLAMMKENEGKIEEAANIMQELQVETFGTMDKREKVELILEQMRLCLAKKDYIRTQIISKKIHTKFFEDESVQDLKFKYYKLMIELDENEGSYLLICKHYLAVFNTKSIKEDPSRKHEALKNCVLYVVLAPYNNEQSDLIHRIKQEKALQEVSSYNDILKLFITAELINWRGLIQTFEPLLKKGTTDCPPTNVFANNEKGNQRWNDLKNRVVEHVRTLFQNNVSLPRLI